MGVGVGSRIDFCGVAFLGSRVVPQSIHATHGTPIPFLRDPVVHAFVRRGRGLDPVSQEKAGQARANHQGHPGFEHQCRGAMIIAFLGAYESTVGAVTVVAPGR